MNPLVKSILVWVATALVAALAVALIVHGYEAWRGSIYDDGKVDGRAEVQRAWDKDQIARGEAQARAVDAARSEERNMAAAAAKGEKNALDRAQAKLAEQAAAARRSAAAAGGLSGQLADLDAAARGLGIPDAAACPGLFAQQRDAAIRARSLFGACVAEYRNLAADADRDTAAIELRLDTALGWIRASAAPGADELMQLPP